MTNGFNQTKVYDTLSTRIGWKQPTDLAFELDSDYTESDSNRFFDDFHPLVNAKNICDIQPDADIDEEGLNTYIASLNKSCIYSVLNSVFDRPQLIESGLLSDSSNNFAPTSFVGSNFVGWRFKVADGYAVNVGQALLTFDSAVTFNLYLYHSRKKTPLQTKSVTTVAGEQVEVDLGWEINNYDYKGGYFYVGYKQTEIGSAKALCYDDEFKCFRLFECKPINTPLDGSYLNHVTEGIQLSINYGINLDVTAFKDYTNAIISSPHVFDNAIGLMMAANVIEMIIHSMRVNSTERMANNEELQRLYVSLNTSDTQEVTPFIAGIKQRLQKTIKELRTVFFDKFKTIVVTPC